MTKQNKKTLQTIAKKTMTKRAVTKAQPTKTEKAPEKTVDFKTALHDTGDLRRALRLTKKQRAEYLHRLMATHKSDLLEIATRLGVGMLAPDNNPLKSDIAKIKTIGGNSKPADMTTARMVYATALAYLNRDSDAGFSRVFPTGLFLENGILQRLFNAGLIKSAGGENEKQSFTFTEKAKNIITDSGLLKLEKQAIERGLI